MIPYLLRLLRVMTLAAPVYLFLRRPWCRPGRREVAMALFSLFVVGLLVLALDGEYTSPRQMLQAARARLADGQYMNLRPFYTIRSFFKYTAPDDFLVNIVGNVVMFLPWGFGLPLLWERNRRPWRVCLLCFLLTALIETAQLFIGRHFDVDDMLLNFLGGVAGAGLWWLLQRRFPYWRGFST